MLSFVAYFETLLQLSLHLCQFTCTRRNFGKNQLLIIFLKNAYSAKFSVLKHSLKNAWLPLVFFMDFNSP